MIWLAALMGCTSSEHPAPVLGTTYRIGKEDRDRDSELYLDILTTEAACRKAKIDELDICRPFVDRAHGEVHLAFQFLDRTNEQNYPVALRQEPSTFIVSHDRSEQQTVKLTGHKPRDSGQLYIVLIDGSGSMYADDGQRIKKVKNALLRDEVLQAFFPSPDAQTGVMLLMFTDKLQSIDGGEPRIIRKAGAYKKLVEDHLLTERGGYTHLYKAVREAMTEVLKLGQVRKFMGIRHAQPTVIALTDGFNNEAGSDLCKTNVPRLQKTLDTIRDARAKRNSGKPVLFTIGLGRKFRNADKPKSINAPVTAKALCGQYADSRIDGALENQGIDHISLAWLAEAGGGVSFVKNRPKGLAEVFLRAAEKRYEWFDVKYRVPDSIFHRKSFETEIRVQQRFRANSKVDFYPSPWLDAPTAEVPEGDQWVVRGSLLKTLTLLMPALGILVFLNYLPAALFNARRALTRRAKPRK